MKERVVSIVRRVFNDRRGQALPWIAAGLFGLIAAAGLTVDVGHSYVLYSQLRSSTEAAALAAASGIYDTPGTARSAVNRAIVFGSGSTGYNAHPGLTLSGPPVVTLVCLNSLMPKGMSCDTTSPTPNAVKVTQAATAPTYFLKVVGISSIPMSVTATAAPNQSGPWNVAIVLDSTGSMTNNDANCGGVSQYQCALNGIQALLAATNPCLSTPCTDANTVLRVSLFAFPNVSQATVAYDSNCEGTPQADLYTFPMENATSYMPLQYTDGTSPWTGTYQIVGFSSDYYQPTASNGLNPSSSLVKAVTGCMKVPKTGGSQAGAFPGGYETYYAAAIYAAQSALLQAQSNNPGTKNAIIFLSDGQANILKSVTTNRSTGTTTTSIQGFPTSGMATTPAGSGYSFSDMGTHGAGIYPDALDDCQQGVVAAAAAASAGTRVYSVAYGSETTGCGNISSGGGTDKTLVATGSYNVPIALSTFTPCEAMEDIASSLDYFYSDYKQSGSGSTCQDAGHTVTSLNDIFLAIAGSLGAPKLISNSAT